MELKKLNCWKLATELLKKSQYARIAIMTDSEYDEVIQTFQLTSTVYEIWDRKNKTVKHLIYFNYEISIQRSIISKKLDNAVSV